MEKDKMEPIPDYGDHMTMEQFIGYVKSGSLINYDGFGCYATATEMSSEEVYPSHYPDRIKKEYTHVVWFNR